MAKSSTSSFSLRSLFRGQAQKRDVTVGPTDGGSIADIARQGDLLDFGVPVDNNIALKNTTFFSGLRLISENIASLPKVVLAPGAHGMVEDREHPAYRLINVRPNAYTNANAFWRVITTWIKGWGNAYALIVRDSSGTPIALHQAHPSGVRVTIAGGRKWYQIVFSDTDLQKLNGTYPDEDVLHFMEISLDGIKGVNPVLYNAAALGKSLATEKFAAEFYRKGGNIRAIMETDGHLGDDEYKAFTSHIKSAMQNFETPLLEYGIKYNQLSVDPVAAQLIQSETLSIQDVCRILNIPPHMVAELSHATFSNIEHQTIQFVQYSLRPVIKAIEVELESKLFFSDEIGEYDVKFVLDGLLRGDTSARSAYYHNAILDGYMTRNEVRQLEGLPYAEGLDAFLYPANEAKEGESEDNDNNTEI